MEILTELDLYREALSRVNMNEEVMPFIRGKLLRENVDVYAKIQKILNCDCMANCHRFLYDLDVENLTESEITKVCNLYKLGQERGVIEADEVEECDDVEVAAIAVEEPAVEPVAAKVEPQKPELPASAYVVLYSAMRDGQIKTGEAFSNAINTRSAKADVINKLEKAGYQNVSILAIEAGDPDMAGATNSMNVSDNSTLEDSQINEWRRYNHETGLQRPRMYEPTDADMAAWHAINARENLGEYLKGNYAKIKNSINTISPSTVKKFINDNSDKFANAFKKIDVKAKTNSRDAKFQTLLNKCLTFITAYADAQIDVTNKIEFDRLVLCVFNLLTFIDEKSFMFGGLNERIPTITTFYRHVDELENEMNQLPENVEEADEREPLAHALDIIGVKASTANSIEQDAVATSLHEEDDEEKSDDSDDSEKSDDSEDADEKEDSEDTDDKEADDAEEEKEESAEEPDEKLKGDEEDKEEPDATDDKKEDELSDAEKGQLKDSYKKAFKAAMIKCKYTEKSFDDLTLDEKVKFFTELSKAWGKKADPSKFMSDKEMEALEAIVVKK